MIEAPESEEDFEGLGEEMMNNNYNQGVAYYSGSSVTQDYPKAMEFFLKAASQGHPDAQNQLEAMFEKGIGGTQDLSKFMEWYRRAA
ncbi:hypothetical protein BGX26_009313, partial [Mortierella sp. AD094]